MFSFKNMVDPSNVRSQVANWIVFTTLTTSLAYAQTEATHSESRSVSRTEHLLVTVDSPPSPTVGGDFALLLAATETENSSDDNVQLGTLRIEGKAASSSGTDGSTEQGYKVDSISVVGPLGSRTVLDTPYSINIISSDLIENIQAATPDDVFKINPVTQLTSPSSRFFSAVNLRGFNTNSIRRVDGLPENNYSGVDLEDKERIEVLTGVSGFLYGMGNVGGTVNYILKRPTYERLNSITVGNRTGESYFVHGDFGGPLDSSGTLAYRINAALQDGNTYYDEQSVNKQFLSGALDWNVNEDVLVQFDMMHSDYRMNGSEPYWTVSGVDYPDPPDPEEFYSQDWTLTDSLQQRYGVKLQWNISDRLTLRTALSHSYSEMDLIVINNTITSMAGDYLSRTSKWEYPDITNDAGYVFLDTVFATGDIDHKITLGVFGDNEKRTNFRIASPGWTNLGVFNLSNPAEVAEPSFGDYTSEKSTASLAFSRNVMIGDDIRFSEHWSSLIGLNRASIKVGDYDKSAITPTVTLLYKPQSHLSTYASYSTALEQGGTAAPIYNGLPVLNDGEIMEPLESDQYELGVKAEIDALLLTAALFQIDKGLEYYDQTSSTAYTYVQDGRQVHKGLEFTATGKVTEQLTLIGGFTLLNPKIIKNEQNPQWEGNLPADVATRMAKFTAEYNLVSLRALTLMGGVYFTGDRYANNGNTDSLPAFTTYDIGGRYVMELGENPFTLRLNINNITNEAYWLKSNYLGMPRTIMFSANMEL